MADTALLRSWWASRQGLDGSWTGKPPAEILQRSGWARSVGGVGPYLTIWSRGGNTRASIDAAVAECEIHEIPAARGCTYVVPSSDFTLALRAGAGFGYEPEMKTARKLGVTDAEIDKLCQKVVDVLVAAKQPLDPEGIRGATGNVSRNLGPEGQKKGLTTTLPLALGRLQAEGEIRRVPTNGRLDQQRYAYVAWRPNPLRNQGSPEEVHTELARRYFGWIGPATLAEFQWFSGLGVKAAKAAVEPLKLVPFDEAGRFMLGHDLDAVRAHKPSKQACYTLVSSLDAITLLRRDHRLLTNPEDLLQEVQLEKGCGTLGGLTDLPSHAIFDRGRLIGLWEFDTATQSIAWMSFIKPNSDLRAAVARTEEFVRDQLGDARSFSLDSPKSRVPRIEGIRRLAGVKA
jgi:hypothetical protein